MAKICVGEKYCMIILLIKHKSVGMRKTMSEGKKHRSRTSEVYLICILDQFLYSPVAQKKKKNKLKGHFGEQMKLG